VSSHATPTPGGSSRRIRERQQLLEKYGGDVDKALAAAVDAQELIGRQSSELGELRQYREQVRAAAVQMPPDQILAYAEQDPQQAAAIAYQQYGRQSDALPAGDAAWAEMDPFAAGEFNTQAAMARLRPAGTTPASAGRSFRPV
jgi:hypothetical protein